MVKQKMEDWQKEDARRLDLLWKKHKPAHLTQEKFAESYGLGSQSNVNLYLKGKSKLNLKTVGQFAKALRVKIDEISPTLADEVRDLYRQCDPDRSRDFGHDESTREYIRQLIAEEAEKRERTNKPPTSDNGKTS